MGNETNLSHATPDDIGVLKRRKIEAVIVTPMTRRFCDDFSHGIVAA